MKAKSIAELIEMKQSIEDKRNEIIEYYAESLDTTFEFKKATRVEMVQAMAMETVDTNPYLIYTHVITPDLKDMGLQQAYNANCQPHEIVDKLLTPKEVGELSLAVIGQGKIQNMVKDLKN